MARILIVDDNFDNRTILARMLELGGHDVDSAINGREALDRAEEVSPDLILMDLAMPELDGWTATRRLKEHSDLSEVPVVAVTGHVTTDELRRAEECGCVGFLAKPFEYQKLLQLVGEHLPG